MASPREQILARKVARVPVTIAGVDGPLFVRGLTVGERQALDNDCISGEGKNSKQDLTRFRPGLLRRALMDAEDAPVFTEADEAAIAALPAADLEPIIDEALKLSGMSVKGVEEIAGNSGAGQSAGVRSTSPNG